MGDARTSVVLGTPLTGGFASDNIDHVGTLLQDSSGVGGRVHVMPDGERRFYVSGAQGLSIYNVDEPASPRLLGRFQLPNVDNEDVSVSADGRTILMSASTSHLNAVTTTNLYLYVFTVTDPVGPDGEVVIVLQGLVLNRGAHIVDTTSRSSVTTTSMATVTSSAWSSPIPRRWSCSTSAMRSPHGS